METLFETTLQYLKHQGELDLEVTKLQNNLYLKSNLEIAVLTKSVFSDANLRMSTSLIILSVPNFAS